jgi:hypothetical protein
LFSIPVADRAAWGAPIHATDISPTNPVFLLPISIAATHAPRRAHLSHKPAPAR